jgi:hypothetical protein
MATQPCDGCGRPVSVAGGIANLWSFEKSTTQGLQLELTDGTDHFLCFECVDDLPDEATEADVEALPDRPPDEPIDRPEWADERDGGLQWAFAGTGLGALAGAGIGLATGSLEYWFVTGAAIGLLLALGAERLAGRSGS